MRSLLFFTIAISSLLAGCSESTTTPTGGSGGSGGTVGPSGGAGGAGAQGGSGGTGAGATTSPTGGGGGTGGTPAGEIVINEIRAAGGDYVELMNIGDGDFDLSDHALADSLDDGTPKVDEAARFPKGTVVPPFGYVLVLAGQDPADGVGPHDVCIDGAGPDTCFYATWGISDGNGDTLFLLSPSDAVLAEVPYPPAAAPAGNTWGRLPDGTGDFTVTAPTPGDPNKAP